ncbi:MAG: Type 1 glutamine amidotransferase-like domain-containing protein [Anaerolineales bacterium]|nr:Type 1 glutamine amidotransferase-like domain-containing protein [Anaerolineales bacterium]
MLLPILHRHRLVRGCWRPVGGGYADVYPGIVAALLERAQGNSVRVVVLPAAYASNATSITPAELELNLRDAERRRYELEEACQRAAPEDVVCSAVLAPIFTRSDAEDPAKLASFTADVTGVFILGGDQEVAMQALANTPAEAALAKVYARGGVIAGTSAGGAMQARTMIAGYSPNFASSNALTRGAASITGDDEHRGLIFGVEDALLDQHFFQRGRMGRLLEATLRADAPHVGIGVDAYTGVRIVDGKVLTGVFGLYTVAVLDAATYGAAADVVYVGEEAMISARNILVHLLAPGDFHYDLATRQPSLAVTPAALARDFAGLALPHGAGPLFLTGGLEPESDVWRDFQSKTQASELPLLVVAAGYPNDRPAQRTAERVAQLFDAPVATKIVKRTETAPLQLDRQYRGIVVLARDQALLDPTRLAAVKTAWLEGTPLLLDGAAAAIAGPVFSAHGPPPTDADAAEVAIQRSFLTGRTEITAGLDLLPVTVEPKVLSEHRWGRLFSLAYAHPEWPAFAVNDGAAVAITADGPRVLGDSAVISLDLRDATRAVGDNDAFVIANGLLDILHRGYGCLRSATADDRFSVISSQIVNGARRPAGQMKPSPLFAWPWCRAASPPRRDSLTIDH